MAYNVRRNLHPYHQNGGAKLSNHHSDDAEYHSRGKSRVDCLGRVIIFAHAQIPSNHNVCADGQTDTEGDNKTDNRNISTDGSNGFVRYKMSENGNVCKVVKLLKYAGQG